MWVLVESSVLIIAKSVMLWDACGRKGSEILKSSQKHDGLTSALAGKLADAHHIDAPLLPLNI